MSDVPLVSVIVPVYNVEDYLDACMETIVAQTYRMLEIVLIDDGSTDGSGALCDKWAAHDARVKVIHQQNAGLSGARNAGFAICSGEYVTFVDSDDVIAPTMVETLLCGCLGGEAQSAVCSFTYFADDPDFSLAQCEESCVQRVVSGREAMLLTYEELSVELLRTVTIRLYRRELLLPFEELFPVGKLHEDSFRVHRFVYPCSRVFVTTAPLYGYRNRQGSIVTASFSMRRLHELEGVSSQIAYYRSQEDQLLVRYATVDYLMLCIRLWERAQGSDCQDEAHKRIHELFSACYAEALKEGVDLGSYALLFASFNQRPMPWSIRITDYGTFEEASESPVVDFCKRLYFQCLGRKYDEAGLKAQVDAVLRGVSASDIAVGFFCGPEYALLGASAAETVERAYMALLNRTSDEPGRLYWEQQLSDGMSIEQLIRGFAQSDEWHELCAEWGIVP